MPCDRLPEIEKSDITDMTDFIRSCIFNSKRKGAVIGISGGLDSAVVAKLCADAIGPENVLCVFMPTSVTPHDDYRETYEFCSDLGVDYRVNDIQHAVDSLAAILDEGTDAALERGNISARCRMAVLFDFARKQERLVVGTSNLSELLMGYFTKFGDGASDIIPIANIYKTHVRQVARLIGIPDRIISKPPTAGLWEGQTDEDEMGVSYDDLDVVLYNMENGIKDDELSSFTGVSSEMIAKIRTTVKNTEHKRRMPSRPVSRYACE